MAVVDHLELTTKRIFLAPGTRSFHPVDDVYKEIRTLRRMDESLRGFDMPVQASGNFPKGGGRYTPRYATFRLGWKIVPEDVSHMLYVTGEQITDEGEAGPACIDFEPLSPTSKVIVQYEPPSAEIIETGVSGLTEEESSRLAEIQTMIQTIHAKLPFSRIASDLDIDSLEVIHGEGSWEGAKPEELDEKLSTKHGTGSWKGVTLEEIKELMKNGAKF